MPQSITVTTTAKPLRAAILRQLPHLNHAEHSWWLLGTKGCHLCEVAEQLLNDLQKVFVIDYIKVDIADLDEDLMMQFATQIPVVLTTTARLDFPFSVLDLQKLI
ncbi:glutaredoxin family protein [Psychrobacter ciconiae]|uniref:glutaredoxin family protein n=1 Tax=Psychrobacter ciconiae TaxID=1553449 RepID=UPI00191B62D2|nr:glutaredoxin family protein [Psychrobacter ciconiae]